MHAAARAGGGGDGHVAARAGGGGDGHVAARAAGDVTGMQRHALVVVAL